MALVGISYDSPIADIAKTWIQSELISAIEIIPDEFAFNAVEQLADTLERLGVPYAFHFLSNSLGSADFARHSAEHGRDLAFRGLLRRLRPMHISEHLTFCRAKNVDLAQNLAVPRTPDMVELFVHNIRRFRKSLAIETELLLENIGATWEFRASTLDRASFYRSIVERSGSYCLLDIHNLYVDEMNFGVDPIAFIDSLPPELIREVHVSGGTWIDSRTYIDSHESKTPGRVFELLDHVLRVSAPRLVVLERSTYSGPRQKICREIVNDLEEIQRINNRWIKRSKKRCNARNIVG